MKLSKRTKIKVFKFIDDNSSSSDTDIPVLIEDKINEFINSSEVETVVDIKMTTQIRNIFIRSGGETRSCSDKTDIDIYYTIIYIPKPEPVLKTSLPSQ